MAVTWLAVAVVISSVSGSSYAQTLADICKGSDPTLPDHATISLNSSRHLVPSGSNCGVQHAKYLTIRGDSSERSVIQCEESPDSVSSAIFSFVDATSLTLENIHFIGCGASLTSEDLKYGGTGSFIGPGQSAILACIHCSDLTLRNVTFSNNTGYSFVGVNLHGNSVLDGVHVLGEDDQQRPLDDPICNQTGYEYACRNKGLLLLFTDPHATIVTANVTLTNSYFDRNHFVGFSDNNTQYSCVRNVFEAFINPATISGPLPNVGALTIAYTQTNFTATVRILDSTFTNNRGECFGAVFVLFYTRSARLAIQEISGCTFIDNSLEFVPKQAGKNYLGSDVTAYMQYQEYSDQPYCILINDSYFKNFYTTMTPDISLVHFPNTNGVCTVALHELTTNTSAKFLYVSGIVRGDTLKVHLRNINMNAKNSKREFSLKGLDQNDGLLMFVAIQDVVIEGTSMDECQFNSLQGPVILTRSADVFLTGEMLFANNYVYNGANGAAIFLETSSNLYLKEPLQAHFCNNSAVSGGAISSTQLVDEFCVFQFVTLEQNVYTIENISSINIALNFTGNSAQLAGNSIYVERMYDCSTRLSTILFVKDVQILYDIVFKFEDKVDNGLLEVSSNSWQICYCKGELTNTSRSALNCAQDSLKIRTFWTYPGKDFTVSIISVDEIYNPVYTTVYNRLHPRDSYSSDNVLNSRLDYGQDLAKVYGYNCTQLNFSILSNTSEYSEATLALYPHGQVDCLALPVVVEKCPPGFALARPGGYCTCSQLLTEHDFACNINTGNISRPFGVWVGVVSGSWNSTDWDWNDTNTSSEMVIGYATNCPYTHCNKLTEISVDNYEMLCFHNRVGVLCGQCPEGMSVVIGFPEGCQKCSNLWLLTILLYALAGVVLVVLMFLLRLTVATGTLNGLIFFANVFNFNILHYVNYKSVWYTVFISFLNLRLGFPICLYDGLTMLGSTYLGFIVPVYLWFIVIVLIFLSRQFRIVSKLTSRSAVPVLATILHLSFSKLLSLSMSGLSVVTLETETVDEGVVAYKQVWYYDGSVGYLGRRHAGLFVLSLFSLLFFIIPYTVFLTGIKLFVRFEFANRVRPFVDAFCAPYKDKWRFWFGLRVVVTIILYIGFTSLRNIPEVLNLFLTVILTLFTMCQVAVMPYKSVFINGLDLFFLIDCVLLNIMGLFHRGIQISSNVFMIPVSLAVLVILGYHIYLVVGKERFKSMMFWRNKTEKEQVVSDPDSYGDNSGERVSERSSLNNTPQATYSTLAIDNPYSVHHYDPEELREPLLEEKS